MKPTFKHNKLGILLRQYRTTSKLSQEKAAELLGVSKPTLSDWESGKRKIPTDILPKIYEFYKLDSKAVLRLMPAIFGLDKPDIEEKSPNLFSENEKAFEACKNAAVKYFERKKELGTVTVFLDNFVKELKELAVDEYYALVKPEAHSQPSKASPNLEKLSYCLGFSKYFNEAETYLDLFNSRITTLAASLFLKQQGNRADIRCIWESENIDNDLLLTMSNNCIDTFFATAEEREKFAIDLATFFCFFDESIKKLNKSDRDYIEKWIKKYRDIREEFYRLDLEAIKDFSEFKPRHDQYYKLFISNFYNDNHGFDLYYTELVVGDDNKESFFKKIEEIGIENLNKLVDNKTTFFFCTVGKHGNMDDDWIFLNDDFSEIDNPKPQNSFKGLKFFAIDTRDCPNCYEGDENIENNELEDNGDNIEKTGEPDD